MKSLKNNREFKEVYSKGNSKATSNLVLYWYPNCKHKNRVGFSISKKIGKAVVRNKLKRRLKEIVRHNECYLKHGYDLVFIARKPVVNLNFQQIKKDVIKLFKKSGIWKRNRDKSQRPPPNHRFG